jgi:hypothetical protein
MDEVLSLSQDDYAQNNGYPTGKFPEWEGLVPTGEPQPQGEMRFNVDYFKIMQDLIGEGDLTLQFNGALAPITIKHNSGVYLVMPMKKV